MLENVYARRGVVARASFTNCRSKPALKLWFPRRTVKLSITCQMFCLKSNPASCAPW